MRSSHHFSREDYRHLRDYYDGDESIMCQGQQVVSPILLAQRRRKEEDRPDSQFLYNDAGTRKFLLSNFPDLATNDYSRKQAADWTVVIYWYFRQGLGDRSIENDHDWEKGKVGSIVQQIRRKIKGLRRNGKAYSIRKRGRPPEAKLLKTKAA
jgi:hypothetical protein